MARKRKKQNPFEAPVAQAERVPQQRSTLTDEAELAGLGARLFARCIDAVIIIGGAWLTAELMRTPGVTRNTYSEVINHVIVYSRAVAGLAVINFLLVSLTARSFGKWLTGLRIVDARGRRVGFVRGVLLRELPLMVVSSVASLIDPLLSFIVFVDALFAFSESRRRLSDRLAGTWVIQG